MASFLSDYVGMLVGIVSFMGWMFIIIAFYHILMAMLSLFGLKLPGIGGLGGGGEEGGGGGGGGGGGRETDLTPVLDRLKEVEGKMDARLENVDTSVKKATETILEVRGIATDVQAKLGQVLGIISNWQTEYFDKIILTVNQIKDILDKGVKLDPAHLDILNKIKINCDNFKGWLDSLEGKINSKIEALDGKIGGLKSSIDTLSAQIKKFIEVDFVALSASVTELKEKIEKMPEEIKNKFLPEVQKLTKTLAEIDATLKELTPDKIKAAIQEVLKEEVKVTITAKASKELKDVVRKLTELVKNLKDVPGRGSPSAGLAITNINELIALIDALKVAWASASRGVAKRREQADALGGLVQNINLKIGNVKAKGTEIRTEVERIKKESGIVGGDVGEIRKKVLDEVENEKNWVIREENDLNTFIAVADLAKKAIKHASGNLAAAEKSRKKNKTNEIAVAKASLESTINSNIDHVRQALRQLKNDERRERVRRGGATRLRENLAELSKVLTSSKIGEISTEIKVLEGLSIVTAADEMDSLVDEAMKAPANINETRLADIESKAKNLKKILIGWLAVLNKLKGLI
jgi:polyhydroxyalkanoate synthesis regulator phasin